MAKLRDVVDKLEVRQSKRANKCRHNSNHKIVKGDLWLIVTPRGPAARDYGYCTECAIAMLEAAQQRFARHLGELRGGESIEP
jgi:hypothetical protein